MAGAFVLTQPLSKPNGKRILPPDLTQGCNGLTLLTRSAMFDQSPTSRPDQTAREIQEVPL